MTTRARSRSANIRDSKEYIKSTKTYIYLTKIATPNIGTRKKSVDLNNFDLACIGRDCFGARQHNLGMSRVYNIIIHFIHIMSAAHVQLYGTDNISRCLNGYEHIMSAAHVQLYGTDNMSRCLNE